MSPTEQLSAKVPRELVEGLKSLALAHDRSVSAELRQALRGHLGRSEVFSDPPVDVAPPGIRSPAGPSAEREL